MAVFVKQSCEIIEFDRVGKHPTPDFIAKGNEIEFGVECKLSYGAQQTLNEQHSQGEKIAELLSEGKTREASKETQFEIVSDRALEDFIYGKKGGRKQTDKVLRFSCNVGFVQCQFY